MLKLRIKINYVQLNFMYSKRFKKLCSIQPHFDPKPSLNLDGARKDHKRKNSGLAQERTSMILNEISCLESTWKEMKQEKNIDEPRVQDIPRAKIFLASMNSMNKTDKATKLKTISISTKSNTMTSLNSLKYENTNLSPTKHSPSKWKKQRENNTKIKTSQPEGYNPQLLENKCGSPIKRYLNRFRQITKDMESRESKPMNATMQIEDILFKNNK